MSSLRERKKQETEECILSTAREIFLSRGYKKTTIAGIARKCSIGVGTFYNYFSSKAQLFLYIFFARPQELEEKMIEIFKNPGSDLVSTFIDLCNLYIDAMKNIDKNLWKEVMEVFFSNIEEHKKTMSEFIDIDFQAIEYFKRLITYYQEKDFLVDIFDPEDGAECLYGIFTAQMLMYLYEDDMSFEAMRNNITRQVELFFLNKQV